MATMQHKKCLEFKFFDSSPMRLKIPPALKNQSFDSPKKEFNLIDCYSDKRKASFGDQSYKSNKSNEPKLGYYSAIFKSSLLYQKFQEQEKEIEKLRRKLEKREEMIERILKDKDILQERLGASEREFDAFKKSNSEEAVLLNTSKIFVNLVESELNCSICNDVIVNASICVPCGHVFCNVCLTRWFKQKKECAFCRTPNEKSVSCKVLDSFIESLIEAIPDKEYRKGRQKVCDEKRNQEKSVGIIDFNID